MARFLFFSLLLIACFSNVSTAQVFADQDTLSAYEDSLENDEHYLPINPIRYASYTDWDEVLNDSAFEYKNKVETHVPEPKPSKQGKWLVDMLNKCFDFFTSGIGLLIFYLLILGIVVYVIYYLFKGDFSFLFGRKESKNEVTVAQVLTTEDLLTTDWEMQLKDSSLDKRLATRYAFMYVLQMLHQEQIISYSKDKTNYQYYQVIDDAEIKQVFQKLMWQYEFAWYGQVVVTDTIWQQTLSLLQSIKQKI